MKNKLIGGVLVVLFIWVGSSSAMAQNGDYLSKSEAKAKLEQAVKDTDRNSLNTEAAKLEYRLMVKLTAVIDELGYDTQQAVEYLEGRMETKGMTNTEAAMDKVKALLRE